MNLSSLADDFPNIIEIISNYDVLLTVSSEPPCTMADFTLDPDRPHHIGNNRFRIMCQMHHQKPEEIFDRIVQHPCLDIQKDSVPPRGGTFLCRDGAQWRELPKSYALAFVEQQVGNAAVAVNKESKGEAEPNHNEEEDEGMKRRRRSSLLRRSLSSGNMLEDQKKRFAFRRSLLLSDLSTGSEEDEDEGATVGGSVVGDTNGGGSVSTTRRPTLERLPSWSEGMDELVTVVHTANALDVIFTKTTSGSQEHYQLVASHHTGNNRLLVMVQLRLAKFLLIMDADPSPQNSKSLCMELVAAVQENYNGRFLVEPEVDKDYFILLSDEEAAMAIHCLFQSEAELEVSAGTATTSASGGDYFDTVFLDPNSHPTMNALVQNNSRTPSLIKREALQQLHELSTSLSDVIASDPDVAVEANDGSTPPEGGIQKFALASLQKRKKRQGLINKISQMVAYNPSAAVVTSRVERRSSVSELPRRSTAGLTRWASTGHSIDQQQDLHNSAPAGLDFSGVLSLRDLGYAEPNVPSTIQEWDDALLEPTDFGLSDVPIREQMQMYPNSNGVLEQHPFFQLQEPVRRRPSALSRFSQVMIQDMLLKFDGHDDWNPSLMAPTHAGEASTAGPLTHERTEI